MMFYMPSFTIGVQGYQPRTTAFSSMIILMFSKNNFPFSATDFIWMRILFGEILIVENNSLLFSGKIIFPPFC
jgi:hypothetical protein